MIMRNKSHNRNKTHGISKIINSKQRMRKCYLLTCAASGNIKTYSPVRVQVSNIMDKNIKLLLRFSRVEGFILSRDVAATIAIMKPIEMSIPVVFKRLCCKK